MSAIPTDLQLLQDMTYRLLENGNADATGTSLQTDQFSISQMVAALNQRQYKFLKDTGCVVTRASLGGAPQQQRYTLPQDFIDERRVTWKPTGGETYSLTRSDKWALDMGLTSWNTTQGDPVAYNVGLLPTLTLEVAPIPQNGGSLMHMYIALSQTLTGLGVDLTVPDMFAPYVTYGAMADLLGSDGPGFDPQRAQYCEQRFQEGVELAKLLMSSTGEQIA